MTATPTTNSARKRLLSGMQPTGTGALHLGNLEGALRAWVRLQDEYEMYCCIVDWHALTTLYDKTETIGPACREVAADYIAAGLDPQKCAIFLQSQVKEHAELHLLLSMITPLGWLERVPTFKEKRDMMLERTGGGGDESISYGLLGYPCLQAADILVYRAHAVPVGRDQAAHLEISREIARRFNHLYGPVFPEPQSVINETIGRGSGHRRAQDEQIVRQRHLHRRQRGRSRRKNQKLVHHAHQNPQVRPRRTGNVRGLPAAPPL